MRGGFALLPEAENLFELKFTVPPGWHVTQVSSEDEQPLPFERYDRDEGAILHVRLPAGIAAGQQAPVGLARASLRLLRSLRGPAASPQSLPSCFWSLNRNLSAQSCMIEPLWPLSHAFRLVRPRIGEPKPEPRHVGGASLDHDAMTLNQSSSSVDGSKKQTPRSAPESPSTSTIVSTPKS